MWHNLSESGDPNSWLNLGCDCERQSVVSSMHHFIGTRGSAEPFDKLGLFRCHCVFGFSFCPDRARIFPLLTCQPREISLYRKLSSGCGQFKFGAWDQDLHLIVFPMSWSPPTSWRSVGQVVANCRGFRCCRSPLESCKAGETTPNSHDLLSLN